MTRVPPFLRRITCLAALLFLLVGGYAGSAHAQAPQPCLDNQDWAPPGKPAWCTKEIRIWNNLGAGHKIYVVWQGSKQLQEAIGCSEGDVWLQNALNDKTKCYPVRNTYLAFINPVSGIENDHFVSINIPWWSRRADSSPGSDQYVDWWRAGRIYIFDDQAAVNDSYNDAGKTEAKLATPGPTCNAAVENACVTGELKIYQVPDGSSALISDHTPFQLNEITFADIGSVPVTGGKFISLNLNYNVSYVDQIYLPLAIGPIRKAKDIGYMGTTIGVDEFRKALETFSGGSEKKWPVYNNPNNKYPKAGIRLPSTLAAFNYYMAPTVDPQKQPVIVPASPPTLLKGVETNWQNCTAAAPTKCPQSALYQPINQAFLKSYATYIGNCPNVPPYLTKQDGSNPPVPSNQYALLRFLHGWVPFNVSCPEPPLPTASLPPKDLGNAPINYIALQYNWEQAAIAPDQWFNPYAQFIHGVLHANSYAFSIDDAASVANVDGDGLIFAIGGKKGLENDTQFPPPLPTYYVWYTFSVASGAGGPGWKSYQLCAPDGSPPNEVMFPPGAQSPKSPPGWGMNPTLYTFPCTITLTDNAGKKYQFKVLKAGIPQSPIWPPHEPGVFDPSVVSCPKAEGFVPPDLWCVHINEVAKPANAQVPPQYTLSLPPPL